VLKLPRASRSVAATSARLLFAVCLGMTLWSVRATGARQLPAAPRAEEIAAHQAS